MLRVRVDDARDVVDQLDDALGHHVAGRRLAGEEHRARHGVGVGVGLQPVVARDDVQQVEQLPLVLVDALDLHVEQRVHVEVDADAALHFGVEAPLVLELDRAELAAEPGVVGQAAHAVELLEVVFPRVAQVPRDQRRQPGVRLLEPAPHGDAVGDVGEAVRDTARRSR